MPNALHNARFKSLTKRGPRAKSEERGDFHPDFRRLVDCTACLMMLLEKCPPKPSIVARMGILWKEEKKLAGKLVLICFRLISVNFSASSHHYAAAVLPPSL